MSVKGNIQKLKELHRVTVAYCSCQGVSSRHSVVQCRKEKQRKAGFCNILPKVNRGLIALVHWAVPSWKLGMDKRLLESQGFLSLPRKKTSGTDAKYCHKNHANSLHIRRSVAYLQLPLWLKEPEFLKLLSDV